MIEIRLVMKKMICFFILSLTACNTYTVQNSFEEDVRAGYVIIRSGQCLIFFDFPIVGDFPLQFRDKNHQLLSDKFYQKGHYEVSKEGDILKKDQQCERDPVRKKENPDIQNPVKSENEDIVDPIEENPVTPSQEGESESEIKTD